MRCAVGRCRWLPLLGYWRNPYNISYPIWGELQFLILAQVIGYSEHTDDWVQMIALFWIYAPFGNCILCFGGNVLPPSSGWLTLVQVDAEPSAAKQSLWKLTTECRYFCMSMLVQCFRCKRFSCIGRLIFGVPPNPHKTHSKFSHI